MTTDAPSLSDTLDQQIEELNRLFENENITEAFRNNMKHLTQYYVEHFHKNNSDSKRKTLIQQHALLLETIKQIKSGNLSSEQASKSIDGMIEDRKYDVKVRNVFKAVELAFWLTAAVASYAFCIGFGIPLMFFNLPLGLALTVGSSALMLQSSYHILDCANQFSSFDAIKQQDRLERSAVSFFQAPKAEEEELNANLGSMLSPCG